MSGNVYIQYNPNTGKVIYNPTTKKVLTLECPSEIILTFTGITECDNCGDWGRWDAWPSDLNDREITLPYVGGNPPGAPLPYCYYHNTNSQGWHVSLRVQPNLTTEIIAWFEGQFTCEGDFVYSEGWAFYILDVGGWQTPGVVNNEILNSSWCCCSGNMDEGGVGYGGTCTWSKN